MFLGAGMYALHNGLNLYREQRVEIEKIKNQAREQREETIAYFDKGEKGPSNRPWVDLTTPFWAIWSTPVYHFKAPSPTIVYSIGQAEQYGFYKRVTFQSSPYDSDMAQEIANPERLNSGTLDFSFVILYLGPLLLLIWLYNIKGMESDSGFLPLIYAQTGSENTWLLTRVSFYVAFLLLILLGLLYYGALLTDVFRSNLAVFGQIFFLLGSYLLLWGLGFTLMLLSGKSSIGNTLKMVGLWLLIGFIIPAAVHQWISIQHPANLMTDFIDAQRDERDKLYNQPDSLLQAQLNSLFPDIVDSPVAQDSLRRNLAMNRTASALANELAKRSIARIEAKNGEKNNLIRFSYWFNPVTFFQNKVNSYSGTDFQAYKKYRGEIQELIDKQLRSLVLDTWGPVEVGKDRYLQYNKTLVP